MSKFNLRPYAHVDLVESCFVSLTAEPWLALDLPRWAKPGRWVCLTYRMSYLDPLVRPIILFEGSSGPDWDLMRAPLWGRASWIGRIPEGARRALISPVNEPGPFAFEIESMERVFESSLLLRGVVKDGKTAAMSVGARLINARKESLQALMFARGGLPLNSHADWRAHVGRPLDRHGIDRTRQSHAGRIPVRVVSGLRQGETLSGSALWASLRRTSDIDWSLLVWCEQGDADVADPRVRYVADFPDAEEAAHGLPSDGLVIFCMSQEAFTEPGLACVTEFAARRASARVIYGDHIETSTVGVEEPIFKPDWSPRRQETSDYIGPGVFLRASLLRDGRLRGHVCWGGLRRAIFNHSLHGGDVSHLRRMVLTSPAIAAKARMPQAPMNPGLLPSVSIIVPTKDKIRLLKACLDGVLHRTNYPDVEIVVVDNGSGPPAQAFYASMGARIRLLHQPGDFNFSAMCNRAAQHAQGDCLVFLNNDVEVIEPDWLRVLAAEAMRDEAGAVGALLLFPSGRIQHAGVTVGMGGYADHLEHGLAGDDVGWLGRLASTHEVAAVTGACIAINAAKFVAVGGFDAEHYPVELNDIDLCLRLAERGWQTYLCTAARLMHRQSASRGFALKPFTRYGRERAAFRERWRALIRDDKYFHPALSLFSVKPALDG